MLRSNMDWIGVEFNAVNSLGNHVGGKRDTVWRSSIQCCRPTNYERFADWSKRRHVSLSIFERRTIHDNLSSDIVT